MSIIQEALNKAQKKNIARAPAVEARATVEAVKTEKTGEKKPVPGTQARSFFYAALFVAILLFFVSRYFSDTPVKPAAAAPAPSLKNTPALAQKAEAVINKETFENTRLFEFPKQSIAEQDGFTLSGIMNLEDGPRAIINNSTLMEGDRIGDATVVKIRDNAVVLKRRDSEITLHLK